VKPHTKIAAFLGALVLALAPATALAAGQPSDPGSQGKGPMFAPEQSQHPETPGPLATLPEKAKAYGHACREESRKHVEGQKGTPFSACVTAMAKAANNENLTPRQACKEMSRKHVKGDKGTPFSLCVSAAAKLQHEQQV
jgi:hypothetical protein